MNAENLQAISQGEGFGRVFNYKEEALRFGSFQGLTRELELLESAISAAQSDLEALKAGSDHQDIFEAHIMILNDPEVLDKTRNCIKTHNVSAAQAYADTMDEYSKMFEAMEDEYFRERAVDMRDIKKRVCHILFALADQGGARPLSDQVMLSGDEDWIVLASDLTPSQTASLPKDRVKGLILRQGGVTSHTAILARSMGIPAIVARDIKLNDGDQVMISTHPCKIIVNPSAEDILYYEKLKKEKENPQRKDRILSLPCQTAQGISFKLFVNASSLEDIDRGIENGAQGVGLLRTEFFYLSRTELPSEEEQYAFFKDCLNRLGPHRELVVRTADVGGDKELPYLNLKPEDNPFLGLRGIRFSLRYREIFETQLRAILRAAVGHPNLKIMFPMVSQVHEFISAKKVCKEVAAQLGLSVPKLGIMIETPAAALMVKEFALHVDFFSIGTNDLIQYTHAVDRGNPDVSYLYDENSVALWQLLEIIGSSGVPTSLCGQMASEVKHSLRLVGLGITTLSCEASSLIEVKAGLVTEVSIK